MPTTIQQQAAVEALLRAQQLAGQAIRDLLLGNDGNKSPRFMLNALDAVAAQVETARRALL